MIIVNLFKPDIEEMEDLARFRSELMDHVQSAMLAACDYRNSFDNYSSLWMDERNEVMRQFLTYNHTLTAEELEAHIEDGGIPECPPTLEQFKQQVNISRFFNI